MKGAKETYRYAALRTQLEQTGQYLIEKKVVLFSLPFSERKSDTFSSLSWRRSETNYATGDDILKIEQYLEIYRNRQFHYLLFDGSLIRFSFCFKKNRLMSENLLWWPCPIRDFQVDNLDEVDALIELLDGALSKEDLEMRSPIRMDCDIDRDEETHPIYHLHFENSGTRIGLNKPLCVNGFMRFILQNFYPSLTLDYSVLEYLDFKTPVKRAGRKDFFEIGSYGKSF